MIRGTKGRRDGGTKGGFEDSRGRGFKGSGPQSGPYDSFASRVGRDRGIEEERMKAKG